MITFVDIYSFTLPIIATENLVMGLTLLMCNRKGNHKIKYRLGFRMLSYAMLSISLINYIEYFYPKQNEELLNTLAITIAAASTELFLLFYTYMALLKKEYITHKRIFIEILSICLFTLPAMFIDSQTTPTLFNLAFYIGLTYYVCKLIFNVYVYQKTYTNVQSELQNYYSDGDKEILDWIHRTFYVIIFIGVVSIFVLFTNYGILTAYQIFVFSAYFYIYKEVIKHEFMLNNVRLIDLVQNEPICKNRDDITEIQVKQVLFAFDNWIAERHYAKPGLTIEDVALQLNTNRTTLSLYLNSELNMNFYEWISKIRVESAKNILINKPTLPIAEVALLIGVEDRSNFDKLFKRIEGVSPSNYRIQYAKKELNISEAK